jgi:hypothetical protein
MPGFEHAPPAATVDGLFAVPIDIERVDATLRFDGSSSSGEGDATVAFTVGPEAGNPIFDLRQTVTAAWLDGVPLPAAQVAHHDFGGGPDAALRVLEQTLPASSVHALRLTYALGTPQASSAGSYPPGMRWGPGPRLTFNFGFTDLGAGRYLEAWVPANLIYDEFVLTLAVELAGTAVPHSVITNGAVMVLGPNSWSIQFPGRFTALSPLLEIRAADSVSMHSEMVTLPVSGATVAVEAWTPNTSGINLPAEVALVKSWLADNESTVGPYIHGSRFTILFNVGGMEYEGGATSDPGSARHETYHSWWGRGIKPAAQPDGWIDEAWNRYHDLGGAGSTPLDFSLTPVELCTRNPWSRVTPLAAYSSGEVLFEGLAATAGVGALTSAMHEIYQARAGRLITTAELEELLLCRTGRRLVVDAFHRFVYGLADTTPAADLWLRDDPLDAGQGPSTGGFWNSPDLWIRNADDGGVTHEPPIFGRDNWFHARVRNRSATRAARHFVVSFNVKPYAGTEFVYPSDFLPCIAAVAGFDLAPGASTVVRARWPAADVPAAGTHACWLAAVLSRGDVAPDGTHVWEQNNLAQKNLTIVTLPPGGWLKLPFVITPIRGIDEVLLALRPAKAPAEVEAWLVESHPLSEPTNAEVSLHLAEKRFDARQMWTSEAAEPALAARFRGSTKHALSLGTPLRVDLAGARQRLLALEVRVPATARAGERMTLDLVREDPAGRALGGIAVEIAVRAEPHPTRLS